MWSSPRNATGFNRSTIANQNSIGGYDAMAEYVFVAIAGILLGAGSPEGFPPELALSCGGKIPVLKQ